MPLHLQSITKDDQRPEYLADLLTMAGESPDELFVSEDRYILSRFFLNDEVSQTPFGSIVFTMKVDDENKALMIIDLDIVLSNENRTSLRFLALRNGSSDANEYYDAETEEDNAHLELETVCRHIVRDEQLVDSCRDVSISAFPFQLTVHENIDAYNKWAGFGKGIKVRDTEYTVHGFSPHFMMPGGTLGAEKEEESFSYLLGTVRSWRDVRWKIGENALDFTVVWLDTALGEIPAAMSREVFDLTELKAGAIIAMNAYIKADLSRPEDFSKSKRDS